MKQEYETEDIKKLYDVFIQLCDYIEENDGCYHCPMYKDMCGNPNKAKVKNLEKH